MIIKGLCYLDGNEEPRYGSDYSEHIILRSFLSQENYNVWQACSMTLFLLLCRVHKVIGLTTF